MKRLILGTPRLMTDQAHGMVWVGELEPFGYVSSGYTNLRFPGQYFDQESGLHYNYFRDYD